jgi:hypothetical protein
MAKRTSGTEGYDGCRVVSPISESVLAGGLFAGRSSGLRVHARANAGILGTGLSWVLRDSVEHSP